MQRQNAAIILVNIALIFSVNSEDKFDLATVCVPFGEVCYLHRPCCGNYKCDLTDTLGRFKCQEKVKLGETCRYTDNCVDILHSVCTKKECQCRQSNVRVSDYACAPLLNTFCWKNETCAPENALCINNECQCKDGYVAEDGKCLPVTMQRAQVSNSRSARVEKFALVQQTRLRRVADCAQWLWEKPATLIEIAASLILGVITISVNAEFNILPTLTSNVDSCTRRDTHTPDEGNTCVATRILYCEKEEECVGINGACINGRCQCRANYVMQDSKCLPSKLAGRCRIHSDCTTVNFALCLKGECTCSEGFFAVNAITCVRALGNTCDENCAIRFSSCYNRKCQCNHGYTQYSERQYSATELGTTCFDKGTCNLIKNAYFFHSECTCNENHIEIDAFTCAPLLNANYSKNVGCAPENSVCIDHKSQSEFRYLELRCIIDENCIDIPYAKYSDAGECICRKNYVRTSPTTWLPTLGGSCSSNRECVAVNAECFRNQCRYSPGYTQHSDDLCFPVFLGQKCDIDEDCDEISNAECSHKRGQCKEWYKMFDRKVCLPLIGTRCTEHKECAVYNSNCIDNKCQCLETFVPQTQSECVTTGVALILGINAAQTDPTTNCVQFGGTCDQHRRCCGENLKCDQSITFGIYECTEKAKLGDSCRLAFQCVDILHSVCSKNECVCRQNNVRVSDYACAPILNGYCWKNETCATENSLCIDNECQCRDGFVAEANECMPGESHLIFRDTRVIKSVLAVIIGSKCSNDAACASVKFAKCSSNNVCVCSENAIEINGRLCSIRLGATCQTNDNCTAVNSWCDDNKCQCKAQHFAYSEIECRLAFIGMPCNKSWVCDFHFMNSRCINKTCQCLQNYMLKNGNECSPVTSSYCSTTDKCLDAESVCIASRCQCKPNYVMREFKCLPQELPGRCNKDSDCSEVTFAVCSRNECVCLNGFFNVNATACAKALGGSCNVNKDCAFRFSHCFEKKCKCDHGYVQYSESQCIARMTCSHKSNCSQIKNAHCFESQCSCKDNHIEMNAFTCAPLLNATCSNDLNCAPPNSICIDHKCQCEFSYFPKSNYDCVLMYLERRCRVDKDCIDICFAKCSDAGKCICHQNYVLTGPTTCSPTLGGYCASTRECVALNAECSRNQCHCSPGYTQHSDDLCLPVFLGQKCDIDEDCDKISNAKCSDKRCQCKEGYTKFDRQVCLPLIGANCTEHKECAVYNSNCVNNKCQCLETFVPQTQSECVATGIDSICYSNDDCHAINSHCSRFNFCVCNENYISFENTSCVLILGAHCWESVLCITPYSDCIDNKCQCSQGFVPGPYNDCVLVTLGSACATDRDCKNIPNAICIDDKCVCKPETFALTPSVCTHLLNTNCLSSNDCGIDASHCFENKCQCKPDWAPLTDIMCVRRKYRLFYSLFVKKTS
ncbi:neurogenic locus notch homolog protein 1-like [Cotesia glomerata]|uniref:neurogenic locus notch homolog protein 1-like n=1 Tax=Cotesia glomerata TaxID=32391 RepID=UPI001D01D99E|nr:neurogenic locus notch homolog protein 1-like [Cotesia glomerata]